MKVVSVVPLQLGKPTLGTLLDDREAPSRQGHHAASAQQAPLGAHQVPRLDQLGGVQGWDTSRGSSRQEERCRVAAPSVVHRLP
jgi:hypothetical protein